MGKAPRKQFRPSKEKEEDPPILDLYESVNGDEEISEVNGNTHSEETILSGGERNFTGRDVLDENLSDGHYGPT